MYLILIAAGFLASVAVSLILQRLSKSNQHLSRLKKTMHMHEHTMAELANQQSQKIKDAFLDYEMLLQQGAQLQSSLRSEMDAYSQSLEQVRGEQALIEKLSIHLNEVAANASTVSERVESLDLGMQKLSRSEQQIEALRTHLASLSEEVQERGAEAQLKLQGLVGELAAQMQIHAEELGKGARSSFGLIEQEQVNLRGILDSHKEQAAGLAERLEELPQALEAKWSQELKHLAARSKDMESEIQKGFLKLEDQLGNTRQTALVALQDELKVIRREMEDMNLQTMSRRDEILNEAKRMAYKVQEQTQRFQEHYLESENRLIQEADTYKEQMEGHIKKAVTEWEAEHSTYKEESRQHLDAVKEESRESLDSLKSTIKKAEQEKNTALATEAQSLKEDMQWNAQELKSQLESEKEKAVQSLENAQKDISQKLSRQISEAETLSTELLNHSQDLAVQTQEGFSKLQEHADELSQTLTHSLQEKYHGMEKYTQESLEKQQSIYDELKSAALHTEEDLKERLNIEGLVSAFEQASQDKLAEMQSEAESSVEKFNEQKEDIFAHLENYKGTLIQELEEQNTQASEIRLDLNKYAEELYEQQTKIRLEWEDSSKDLSAKVDAAADKPLSRIEETVKAYIAEQERAYNELKEAAANMEQDLSERFKAKELIAAFEKEAQKKLNEIQENFHTALESYNAQKESFSLDLTEMTEGLVKEAQEKLNEIQESIHASWEDYGGQKERVSSDLNEFTESLVKGAQAELNEAQRKLSSTFDQCRMKKDQLSVEIYALAESVQKELSEQSAKTKGSRLDLQRHIDELNQREKEIRISLAEHFQGLKEKINTDMKTKQENMTALANEYIAGQKSAYAELKQAAAKIEKDLRERMDIDTILDQSEAEAIKKFSELKRDMLSSLDELEVRKEAMLGELSVCDQRMHEFEKGLQTIDKAESFALQLDETVQVLDERLELARKENSHISEYAQNFEELRSSRKELESEVRILENQRLRLNEAEKQLEQIHDKMNMLGDAKRLALAIEKRVTHFHEFKEGFDHYFGEMQERKQYIEEALVRVESSRQEAIKVNQQSQKLIEQVNRTELRQEHLHDRLQQFELRASGLENIQKKVQEVEVRFEQMDGLMLDLEKKQKQISTMAQRFNEIKDKGGQTVEELNSMFSEADEKMDKLTAFYHMVDTMLDSRLQQDSENYALNISAPGGKKKKQGQMLLPEHKRDGILSLYINHKWQPDLIAKRMKVELPIVKAVIASHVELSEKV